MNKVAGKIQALRYFAFVYRNFKNWKAVWSAFRNGLPMPTLEARNGLHIYSSLTDDVLGIYTEIFSNKCYTDKLYKPSSGDTIIDIGGNIGLFAISIPYEVRGAKVHSFEPVRETRERLERNVVENGLSSSVTVYPYAVHATSGHVTIHKGKTAGHSSTSDNAFTGGDSESVETITLRQVIELVGAEWIDLLKMDIEGSEVEALSGDLSCLQRVRRIVVEYHGLFRPGSREHVMEVLRAANYDRIVDEPDQPDGQLGLIKASRI